MKNLVKNMTENIKYSIALKLSILLAAFGVLASGLTGYYTYNATRDILIRDVSGDLLQSTRIMGRRFSLAAESVAKDALFFAQTPQVRELVGTGEDAKQARQALTEQFKSMLGVHPEYVQARFISAQDYGAELVRVDRDNDRIVSVSGLDLQEKLHYPYVYETLKLAAGKVHYSKIFINRETGAHAGLKQPTLQVATPVIDSNGNALGIIVINVDLKKIFGLLTADLRSEYQLYLTNQAGDFLMHPDSSKTFGFDYGRRFLVQDSFKPVASIVDNLAEVAMVRKAVDNEHNDVIGGFARLPFGDVSEHHFVILGLTVPLNVVLQETDALLKNNSLIVIALSMLAIFLSVFVAFVFVSPLKRLVTSVQLFAKTRELSPVVVNSKDEIGILAHSVNQMQEQVLAHLNTLNLRQAAMESQALQDMLTMAELKRLEEQKQEALSRLHKIASRVPGIVFQLRLRTDGTFCVPYASEMMHDIYQLNPEDLLDDATPLFSAVHPSDLKQHLASIEDSAKNMTPWQNEYRLKCEGSQDVWLLGNAIPQREADGSILWHGFVTDNSANKLAETELRIAATAFESQDGIFITDAKAVIIRVNQAFTEITGYTLEDAVGQTPGLLSSGHHDASFYVEMWDTIRHAGKWHGEIWNRRKNGDVYPEQLNISAVKGSDGEITHYVAMMHDITSRKAAEHEINNLAFFDPLTNLPNRRLLQDRLKQALASSARNDKEGALLFIDLDHFKNLNDTLGHNIGDLLLQQVAERLISCIRQGDTVSRLGGDEFVILLEDLSADPNLAAAQTEVIAGKILASLNQDYQLESHVYHSTPSIGVTTFLGNSVPIDELMKRADIAMYQAKKAGRNGIRFFDPEMQAVVDRRLEIEQWLEAALQQKQFTLYYQPQVNGVNEIVGAEVLLRLRHPKDGIISPAEFIPVAEETGMIVLIGQWVLETACLQLKAWEADLGKQHLQLAVNVSAHQFHQDDFVDSVIDILKSTGIKPHLLKLELTESMMLDNIAMIIVKMQILRGLGIQFSMDDFGTGHSSLASLKKLPLDQLKIDQSFVRDITTDYDDAVIVQTIIAMANSLSMDVIAEGVETLEQKDFLTQHYCLNFQGYLFGRPMPVDEFEKLLTKG